MSTLTIFCTQDTYVSEGSKTTNYAESTTLTILSYTGDYDNRAFLKFPTEELVGATINSAKLYIYYLSNDTPSRPQHHRVKRITSDWIDISVTYNNQPTFYGSGGLDTGSYGKLYNVDGTDNVDRWRYADITTMVQEWSNGTYINYGLCIDHTYSQIVDGGYWASIKYYSRDKGEPYIPYIVIDYTTPVSTKKRRFAQII